MKNLFFAGLALLAWPRLGAAENHGRLIFQDDFARSESQEKTDEPGNGWIWRKE